MKMFHPMTEITNEKELRVILARPRGFCAGVERAIEIVERALDKYGAPVYVRHEIVHNKHVVNALRKRGAIFVKEVSDVPDGAVTIFSAHGVAESVETEARTRDLPVIDATCPLVTKVHYEGQRHAKTGNQVVLIGHAGHPEVEGTQGRIPGGVLLVTNVDDVATLEPENPEMLAYVTQTTLSVDETRDIISALKARFPDIIGPDVRDICYATQNRQTATRDLAEKADLLVVIGAKNSSNSNRLREIGEEMSVPSYLIDDAGMFDPAWLEDVQTIGITAGASAPEKLVTGLIDHLKSFGRVRVDELVGAPESMTFNLPRELRDRA